MLSLVYLPLMFHIGVFEGQNIQPYMSVTAVAAYILHNVFIGHLLATAYISNEYSYGTAGHLILSGYTRKTVFITKSIVFCITNLIIFYVYLICVFCVFVFHERKFGIPFSMNVLFRILLLLLLATIGILTESSFIIFFSILIKKKVWAIAIGLTFIYFLGQLDNANRDKPIPGIEYTWVYQIRHLYWNIDLNSIVLFIMVTVGSSIIAFCVSKYLFDNSEIR